VIEAFHTVVDTYTAGNPQGARWTNLTRSEMAAGLATKGFHTSVTVVDRLLEQSHMRPLKPQKVKTMRRDPQRDAQFRHIDRLKRAYLKVGLPVLSMDTKKRELLGDYVRAGRLFANAPPRGWDHDFPTRSPGVAIPHGLYDLARNEGYLHLGASHDTSQFAADALIDWWRCHGHARYPQAAEALLLCDAGGSNRAAGRQFKEQLQRVADSTDLALHVAHYPPGCSKYNPIDHRLFPHVARKLQGLFLTSLEMIRDLARHTTTSTGLRVFARVVHRTYEKHHTIRAKYIEQLHILRERVLPQWNYFVLPKPLWEVI
jgi:hypothetical protein